MARAAARFICQDCGAAYRKWQGRCDGCGEWNTVVEEISGGDGVEMGRCMGIPDSSGVTVRPGWWMNWLHCAAIWR